jgi:hypothetical protein
MFLFFCIKVQAQKFKTQINQAVDYVALGNNGKSYNLIFLLKWLKKEYSGEIYFTDFNFFDDLLFEDDYSAFNYYQQLIGRNNRKPVDSLKQFYSETDDIRHLMLWAANPDKLDFDSICSQTVFKYAQKKSNIRQTAHVAIAYKWAQIQMPDKAEIYFGPFTKKLVSALIFAIKSEKKPNDNMFEGLIGLICLGKSHLIKNKWKKMVVNNQNADGGWAWEPEQSKISHVHPTVLAIWILLELQKKQF